MYFDVRPKERLDDFYNMEEELKAFIDSLKNERLVIVKGLRRYGKTSLVLTGLSTLKDKRYIFLDCRSLPPSPSIRDLLTLIESEANKKSWLKKLLRSIEHVEIGGMLRIRIRGSGHEILLKVFESLGDAIVVFDEAQRLRYVRADIPSLLAYLYDHTDLRVVITGSEVGVLEGFLGVGDPRSPLYGRPYGAISLKPLPREKALRFLELGFMQVGLHVEPEVIEKAVEALDGVIGWLTYFGHEYARIRTPVEKILEEASKLAISELEGFLTTRGAARRRYLETLRSIAILGKASWSNIKTGVEAVLGYIPERRFAEILKNLVDYGFVIKIDNEYRIADPILEHALRSTP